ncbi:unnamed protein product, partial [Heterosigma akashiwo]
MAAKTLIESIALTLTVQFVPRLLCPIFGVHFSVPEEFFPLALPFVNLIVVCHGLRQAVHRIQYPNETIISVAKTLMISTGGFHLIIVLLGAPLFSMFWQTLALGNLLAAVTLLRIQMVQLALTPKEDVFTSQA